MTNENEKPKEETGKKNYCDKDGNCTCENYPDELDCRFRTKRVLSGICSSRVWFEDRCLSPFALVAARGTDEDANALAALVSQAQDSLGAEVQS